MRRFIILLLLSPIVILLFVMSDGGARRATTVVVPPGTSVAGAAELLEKAKVVTGWRFRMAARFDNDPIKPGEYKIEEGMSAGAVLALLQSGKVVQRFVVVPEGLPAVLVQERLAQIPLLTGPAPLPREGAVLPDNYAYTRGEARSAVVKRMEAAMTRALAREWKARKPTAIVKNPAETLVLASIVEKETGLASERRLVAAVYTNRLRIGMPLQADPTLIYPVTKGRPLGRRILRSEITGDTPYNTYTRTGLPPGPIANPGLASIKAVLDPAPSKALYFVARGDGSSVFAETLPEHNANVARYYALRRARGEM